MLGIINDSLVSQMMTESYNYIEKYVADTSQYPSENQIVQHLYDTFHYLTIRIEDVDYMSGRLSQMYPRYSVSELNIHFAYYFNVVESSSRILPFALIFGGLLGIVFVIKKTR